MFGKHSDGAPHLRDPISPKRDWRVTEIGAKSGRMKTHLHILLPTLLGLGWGLLGPSAPANAKPVVVELFTSQGCSSCPPADAVLGELASQEDVIALSLPVTYWDYLGWKDTLANAAFTKRQRAYAHKLDLRQVYTPQMVIDGQVNVVGSHGDEVAQIIAAQRAAPAGPAIALTHTGDDLTITIAGGTAAPASILIMPVSAFEKVSVGRGENSGRDLGYHNVVRAVRPIGTYDGAPFTKTLTMVSMWMQGADRCAVLLQDQASGAILSAALMDVPAAH